MTPWILAGAWLVAALLTGAVAVFGACCAARGRLNAQMKASHFRLDRDRNLAAAFLTTFMRVLSLVQKLEGHGLVRPSNGERRIDTRGTKKKFCARILQPSCDYLGWK